MQEGTGDHGLRAQWAAFRDVALDPVVLLLLAIAVFMGYAALSTAPPLAMPASTDAPRSWPGN